MNRDFQLRVQAFLDGELTEHETRQVERRLSSDEASSHLLEELRWTKNVLAANEPIAVIPETRDFYWSKIRGDILLMGRPVAPGPQAQAFLWLVWKKCFAPFSGLALMLMVVWGIMSFYSLDASGARGRFLAQVESPSEEMGAFSFRSQSDNVFVIWLYERSAHTQSEISLVRDIVIQ